MDFRSRIPFGSGWGLLAMPIALLVVGCGPADTGPGLGGDAGTGPDGMGTGTGGVTPTGTGGSTGMGGAGASTGGSSVLAGSGGMVVQGGTGGGLGTGGRISAGSGGSNSGPGGRAAGGATATGGTMAAGGAGGNITIWLAGDSTVANGSSPCPIGWGAQFGQLFSNRIVVRNSAAGGTSLHTWLYFVLGTEDPNGECNLTKDAAGNPTLQTRWQTMLNASGGMKAGDYLLIQFGINDGGGASTPASPNGCPRYEGSATFKASLGMMAQAAKDRGAHPIFVTPVSSISCSGGVARGTRGRFVTDTIAAGAQYDVPVLDLHMLSVALYTARGFCPLPGGAADVSAATGGAVGAFFCDDHTHFSDAGAVDIGQLVAGGIRSLNLPLAAYLN
jgi:lysophospholipase L1-like esterase